MAGEFERPLVSIVVPIYNTEEYLETCLSSIKCQTYKKIEVVLVNDGSYDDSEVICERFLTDSRFKMCYQENSGLANARKLGFLNSSGEFICFVDSDDKLAEQYVERLVESILKTGADIAQCPMFIWEESSGIVRYVGRPVPLLITPDQFGKQLLSLPGGGKFGPIGGFLCNKLYKRSILNNQDFVHSTGAEDEIFLLSLISRLRDITNVSEPLYYYRRRRNKTGLSQRIGFHEACLSSRKKAIEVTSNHFKPLAYAALIDFVISQIPPYLYGIKSPDAFLSKLLKEVNEINNNPSSGLALEYLGETKRRKLIKYGYLIKLGSLIQKPYVTRGIFLALRVRNFTSEKSKKIAKLKVGFCSSINGIKKRVIAKIYKKRFYSCLSVNNSNLRPQDLGNYEIMKSPFMESPFMNGCTALFPKSNKLVSKAYATWGYSFDSLKIANYAYKDKVPLFLLEDGFIRSLFSITSKDVADEYKIGLSFTIDTKGFYFDGTRGTDLEYLLNNFPLVDIDYSRARALMDFIRKEEITKYNFLVRDLPKPLCGKDLVLVLDQSRGDQSLKFGMAEEDVFERMLSDAIKENPESTIVFKVHPDNLIKGFFPKEVLSHKRVILLDKPVNPIALLKQSREVYVATSQMGMEALICGKKVHVYGMPFYSNWGLTDDKIQNERRKRSLNIEELFYITYCVYSRYINPDLGEECTIENVINRLLDQKKQLLKG